MSEQAVAGNPPNSLPSISAEELHELCQKAYRIGNRARYKLMLGLLALQESGLFYKLGYSSITQYAEVNFGFHSSKTYEYLRVARSLPGLPQTTERFNEGRISWSAVREVTKIATTETEEEWLDYAKKHSLWRLRAEVQDTLEKKRDRPRSDKFGMPNLPVKLGFNLTMEEHHIVQMAFQKVGDELRRSLSSDKINSGAIEPKTVLLFMAQRMLETDPCSCGSPKCRVEKKDSIYTILYRICGICKEAHIMTTEGPVEVPREHITRIEGESKKVEITREEEVSSKPPSDSQGAPPKIDRPNTQKLVEKVITRDGGVCANPCCRREVGLQGHHIVLRSEGGATELYNEITVCAYCHALIHRGLLIVKVDSKGEIHWSRKGDGVDTGLKEEMKELAAVPTVVVESASVDSEIEDSTRVESSISAGQSTHVESSNISPEHSDLFDTAILAFQELGCSKREALERAQRGYSRLVELGIKCGKVRITVEEVVRYGFQSRRAS